jgi:hypothetical protein
MLPFTTWVTLAWAATYVLCIEAGSLALSLASARARLRAARSVSASLFAVILCTITVAILTAWLQQRNLQICFPGDVHYTPEVAAAVRQAVTDATAQARVVMGFIVAVFVFGTATTIAALVRSVFRSRRTNGMAAA